MAINEDAVLAVATQPMRADGRTYPRGTFVARVQRNPATLHERIAALAPALGVQVTAVQSAFADTGDVGTGSGDVWAMHGAKILVAVGDGVYETSYGSLWHFLTRDLGAPFTPVPLRNLGRMDDLSAFNVIIVPDGSGSRMRRELGDGGATALKAWVRSGGVLIGFGGAGDLATNKDLELSTVAGVGADSSLKADSTAPGNVPPLVSPSAAPKDRPEWLPGAIFRATLDPTHWLTLGYTGEKLPVFIDGDVFWRKSKGGANPVVFKGDSLVMAGFTWPGNTERLLKGTTWAAVENQGSGRVVLFLSDPLFRAFWRGPARLVTNAILIGPNR